MLSERIQREATRNLWAIKLLYAFDGTEYINDSDSFAMNNLSASFSQSFVFSAPSGE